MCAVKFALLRLKLEELFELGAISEVEETMVFVMLLTGADVAIDGAKI